MANYLLVRGACVSTRLRYFVHVGPPVLGVHAAAAAVRLVCTARMIDLMLYFALGNVAARAKRLCEIMVAPALRAETIR